MKKIPVGKVEYALVDDNLFPILSQWKWIRDKSVKNYVIKTTMGGERRMHRIIMGAKRGEFVDHKDGNTLNNQWENLRFCTGHQNQGNRKINKNSISGYKGVARYNNKWVAQIKKGKTFVKLGIFTDPKKAAQAYNKAAKEYFGEFARLNQL